MSLVIIFVCVFGLNQFLEVGGEVGGEVSLSKRCVRLGNSHCEKEMIKGNFYDVGRNGWEWQRIGNLNLLDKK